MRRQSTASAAHRRLLLLVGALPALVLAEESGRSLFHEGFESLVTRDGVTWTQPAVFAGTQAAPGGRVTGTAELVPGKSGQALRLSGLTQVQYASAAGNLDVSGGQLSFWVKLGFDPMARNDRTRTVLRNQMFLTLWDLQRAYTSVAVYNAGGETFAVCVFNAERNIVFYRSFQQAWQAGQWHQLCLKWGKEIELWCDGERKASGPFEGLFGPVPVDPATARIWLGSHIGWADVESEFTMDELVISGPAADQISARPRLLIPRADTKPQLDGKLDEPFWQQAARTSGFVAFDRNEMTERQPTLYSAWCDNGLYLAVEVPLPPGTPPRALLTSRDAAIYTEDTWETFLQPPGGDASGFCQFMLSAAGTQFDARHANGQVEVGTYNPDWTGGTSAGPGKWTAEAMIPFAAVGVSAAPAAGQVWRANVCIDSAAGFSQAATWAYTAGNFCRPVYFGEFVFGGGPRALRQETLAGCHLGEPVTSFSLIGDFQPIISVRGEVCDATGASVYKNVMLLRDTKSVDLRLPPLVTGTYTFTIEATAEPRQGLFFQSLRFQTAKALDLAARVYPHAGYVLLRADARGLKPAPARVVCSFAGPNPPPPAEIPQLAAGAAELRVPLEGLAPGTYEAKADAMAADGEVQATAKQTFQVYPRPAWWGNSLGLDHSVPPPFEAVRATAAGLGVWGREYQFHGTVFPDQISNQQRELFTRPPAFQLATDGGVLDLRRLPGTRQAEFPDAVAIGGQQALGALTVQCRTTVEFDGFLRCDLSLTPAAAVQVKSLALKLFLAPEVSRFLLSSNGTSSNAAVLDQPWHSGFLPYLWVGNDDLGLAWFAESNRGWQPPEKRAIEITPGAKETCVAVNLVSQPVAITTPLTFSFGLMASPVRPIPANDPFAMPCYHAKGSVTFSEFLTYPLPGGKLAPRGTIEFWLKRSEARSAGNTAVLQLRGGDRQLDALLLTPDLPRQLVLAGGGKTLLTVPVPDLDVFHHLAFCWDGDALTVCVDGQRVATGGRDLGELWRGILAHAQPRLRFGCGNDWYGYTGIVLDEVRVSTVGRYPAAEQTAPAAPFQTDPDTLLLDPLDEEFKPDGEDALTGAGGRPTIGSSFVPARFGPGLKLEVAPARPAFAVMKELGVKMYTHWEWQREMPGFYGQPVLHDDDRGVPGLKEEVAECHRYGLQTIPYMAYPAVSSTSGLIERFGDEWGLRPLSTTPWQVKGAPEGYYFLNCCLNARGYADYFAAGTAWAMDTYGFDGFYSDGLTNVPPCQNEAHGCGYRDAQGNLQSTWPLFAAREAIKRMYRVVKARKPDGLVANHASFNVILPTLSFSDVLYTGEHEDYENLLVARLRFSSKPWGLYVTLLGSSEHIYSPLHAMVPLLNGTSVWGTGLIGRNDMGRKDAAVRDVYRRFGTTSAVWVPYYQGEGRLYRGTDDKLKVSLYYHKGKDALLLVANLNPEPRRAEFGLDLGELGLAGQAVTARNELTGLAVAVAPNGAVVVPVNARSYVLLTLSTGANR